MTPMYACVKCGRISDERRCPEHRRHGSSWSGQSRDRARQAKFRRECLALYGAQCCYVDRHGVRCPATTNLRAAHWPKPLRDYQLGDPAAWDPQNGCVLCKTHDKQLDPWAR
jgi:hypothetical protein